MEHTLRIIRDMEGVEALRPIWERWQVHPNSDLDHFLLICGRRRNVRRPHVIVVEDAGAPKALLAGRVEDGEVAPNIGYFKPFRVRVTRLAVIHAGLLGKVDDAVAASFLAGLHGALATEGIDVVELSHLPEESPLLRAASVGTPWLWRDGQPSRSIHWDLQLPREPGGMLRRMRSKHRSWVRRKARELEGEFPDGIRYRAFSNGHHMEDLFKDLEQVAHRTYQRGLGAGFTNDMVERERLALFNRQHRLRAWILYANDVPRAFAVGIVYHDAFHFSMTGYDPDFRRLEIGTLMLLHMFDELIREGVGRFDFGLGDAYYKQRFGDRSWGEATLRLYRRGAKGLMARTGAGLVASTATVTRRIADRFGVINRVRTAWRRRLVATKHHEE